MYRRIITAATLITTDSRAGWSTFAPQATAEPAGRPRADIGHAENATASNKRSRRTARWHGLTNPGGRQISGTRPLTPRNAVHGMSGLSGLNASIPAEAGSRNSSPRRKGTYGIYQTSRRSSARPGRVGTAARVAGTAEQPWVAGGRVHA